MNEMIEKIITRHAIRRFADRQLDEETLREILTAGLYAPSAGNNQYSRIVVCQDKAVNLKLGQLSRYMQFKGRDPGTVAHSISSDQPSIQDDFTILDGFYGAPTVLTIFTCISVNFLKQYNICFAALKAATKGSPWMGPSFA